jgi:hypothetical protein
VPFEKKRGINTVTQTQTKLGSDLRDPTGPSAKRDSRQVGWLLLGNDSANFASAAGYRAELLADGVDRKSEPPQR